MSAAMAICARCGAESPEGFRFCGACGAPLVQAPAPRQARKVVTALFCDVTGSTSLGEQLDPEVLRGVLNRYFEEMRRIIERHGGTVEKFIGDAVMAVFGIPRVHEDDALRAVRAAAEIRERLPAIADEVSVELRFRTGVNTGPVLMGEGENLAIGDAINVAARLEQAAEPGEIVLGEETLALVRDAVRVEALEPLELKGKAEPVSAFRLISVDPEAPGVARHMDAPLVGRARELALLRQARERTVAESACHLFTLLGAAGVGKSRLVAELLSETGGEARVLRGRCLPYGEGITFWPLVEALMPVGEPAQPVLGRLSRGGAATPEELFWDVRRLLESLAAEHPVILSLDDLQWAEPMLLDLLDHIADLSRGAPILLLCTARPELLEERAGWGGGKLNATTTLLEPLASADAETLLDSLGDGLDPEARARVIAASEGNPLFLEEIVALARERGTVEVPPTIQALLAARLERLGVEERELLERGAVEGEVFHRLAVKALAGERLAAEVELRLSGLVRKELIRPHAATLQGDEAFRFRHLLVRDAAYDGLPKATRAELHERFARWVEAAAVGLVELDEIAGWHLEQAVRYRRELGREVPTGLATSAAQHLHAAGLQASRRADTAAAQKLLERALLLAPDGQPLRSVIALDLGDELIPVGEMPRVEELLGIAEVEPSVELRAGVMRLHWMLRARPRDAAAAIDARLPGLLDRLTAAGDERGLANAHMLGFMRHWLASQAAPAMAAAERAAEHARKAGDMGLHAHATAAGVAAVIYGPTPADQGASELDRIEAEGRGLYVRGFVEAARAEVERLEAHFDSARDWAARSCQTFAELGSNLEGLPWDIMCEIEQAAGNLDAALAAVQESDRLEARGGTESYRSTTQARLAEVQAEIGNVDAALAAIEFCERLSADEDVINFAMTNRLRSAMALADGNPEAAERLARSSVGYADQTDFPLVRADSRVALARALAELGRREEARSQLEQALALREAKGDRTAAAQARLLLDEA